MLPETVLSKLETLPIQPGVYLFKDKKGVVVYVGKAKSLRSRVRSYFQESGSDTRQFIPFLWRILGDVETVVTGSEKEAAILEHALIRQHDPRFNVKLRDDKEFISLRLATTHPWPRLDVVRKPQDDGARYFGPYPSATSARRTLHLVNKHFQLRTCSDLELKSRRRPCLQHQIKRCPAPCVLEVDPAWYAEQVRTVELFLDSRHDELSKELKTRMEASARALRFELAAVYRDQLDAVGKVREEQRMVSEDMEDRDVVATYREGDLVEIALLVVRNGRLADVMTFSLSAEIPDEELVGGFLGERYGEREGEEGQSFALPPKEILVPVLPEGAAGIAEWLSDRAGRKVEIAIPRRGPRAHLMALANENAKHAFLEKSRAKDDVEERLKKLQEILRLPSVPRRIECCDISHLGGGDTVGAVVAFLDGVPDKKRYRSFHVRAEATRESQHGTANDDYAAMYEVLARRFRRGLALRKQAGDEPPPDPDAEKVDQAWELPDLFVVDGGRGQLGVALTAARDLGLHDLPIVALAKERVLKPASAEAAEGETVVDRVYLPGQKNPIALKSHSQSLFFLARARDEAHRFSNRARERLGKARRFKSILDDIPGIGPVLKKSLLLKLGTVAAIKAATDDELLAVPGVRKKHIDALRRAL
ncbi:excinuclease ABC subunit UvrC [soil metagenome]